MLWHWWLGDWKGIRPVKNWMLVCWWWWFDWSFARLIAPVVTTTSIILCFSKPANPGSPGEWPLKRREGGLHFWLGITGWTNFNSDYVDTLLICSPCKFCTLQWQEVCNPLQWQGVAELGLMTGRHLPCITYTVAVLEGSPVRAPCMLRGCKNRPAPFPGRMS